MKWKIEHTHTTATLITANNENKLFRDNNDNNDSHHDWSRSSKVTNNDFEHSIRILHLCEPQWAQIKP